MKLIVHENHFEETRELPLAIGYEDELLAYYISFERNCFKSTSYFNFNVSYNKVQKILS